MKKGFAFVSLLFFLSVTIAVLGNDAAIQIEGGAAKCMFGKEEGISMVEEEVMIFLEESQYVVEATFHFSNQGETKEIFVGFPKFGAGRFPEFQGAKNFTSFETWVNGAPVKFEEYLDSSSLEISASGFDFKGFCKALEEKESKVGSIRVSENSWIVKKVQFLSNKITETKVKYSVPYHELFDSRVAYYIFGTGSTWKGNIGKAKFRILSSKDIPEIIVRFSDSKRHGDSHIKKISENEYEIEMINFKPDYSEKIEILKDFPPE
jgi:hypothetical protein